MTSLAGVPRRRRRGSTSAPAHSARPVRHVPLVRCGRPSAGSRRTRPKPRARPRRMSTPTPTPTCCSARSRSSAGSRGPVAALERVRGGQRRCGAGVRPGDRGRPPVRRGRRARRRVDVASPGARGSPRPIPALGGSPSVVARARGGSCRDPRRCSGRTTGRACRVDRLIAAAPLASRRRSRRDAAPSLRSHARSSRPWRGRPRRVTGATSSARTTGSRSRSGWSPSARHVQRAAARRRAGRRRAAARARRRRPRAARACPRRRATTITHAGWRRPARGSSDG